MINQTNIKSKKALFLMALFCMLFSNIFFAKIFSHAIGQEDLISIFVPNDNESLHLNGVDKGEFLELFKIKITAETEDVEITNMRLYGEKQNTAAIESTDMKNAGIYDSGGKQLASGSLYKGYWTFLNVRLKILAGTSQTLIFKASLTEDADVGKFRIVANKKYIDLKNLKTGELVGMNDINLGRSIELTNTDVGSYWIDLNKSTKPKLPDLYIFTVNMAPINPVIGDEVCIFATLKNFGVVDIENEDLIFSYYVNDRYIGKTLFGNSLKKTNEDLYEKVFCSSVSSGGSLVKGDNKIKLYVDLDNQIAEINERNNEKTFNFSMFDKNEKLPDLIIPEADCWVSASQNLFVVCNYKIKNIGEAEVKGKLKISANETIREMYLALESGDSITLTISVDMSKDNIIIIKADEDDVVHELDENNNILQVKKIDYKYHPELDVNNTKDIAVTPFDKCGNDVCDDGEISSCPSDCKVIDIKIGEDAVPLELNEFPEKSFFENFELGYSTAVALGLIFAMVCIIAFILIKLK